MKAMKTKGRNGRKTAMLAAVAALVLSLCVMGACSPQQAPKSEGSASDGSATSTVDYASMGYSKFTDADAGFVEDGKYTTSFVNAGNRGCNACHEDLYDVIEGVSPSVHLASSDPGFGRNATWLDCYGCHMGMQLGGLIVKDSIHAVHMSNDVFVNELDGTCFSCHALDKSGDWVMWEFYRSSSEYGGFIGSSSAGVTDWVSGRYWPDDTVAGITLESDLAFSSPEISQNPSNPEDRYSACNYEVVEIDADEWTLKVTGVANEREFTLDELKALPATERTLLEACMANTTGSYQVANIPFTGVLIEDIIEACGGVEEGVGGMAWVAADNWTAKPQNASWSMNLDYLIEREAMIVYAEWGEPMDPVDGYPATLVIPGATAPFYVKWMTEVNFTEGEGAIPTASRHTGVVNPAIDTTYDFLESAAKVDSLYAEALNNCPNTMFMSPVNDGDVLTMEDGKVTLSGIAYNWAEFGATIQQVAISADYGLTWSYIDIPQDLDFTQWVEWQVDWTPEEAGTYVLWCSAIDSEYGWQKHPTTITVVVE